MLHGLKQKIVQSQKKKVQNPNKTVFLAVCRRKMKSCPGIVCTLSCLHFKLCVHFGQTLKQHVLYTHTRTYTHTHTHTQYYTHTHTHTNTHTPSQTRPHNKQAQIYTHTYILDINTLANHNPLEKPDPSSLIFLAQVCPFPG